MNLRRVASISKTFQICYAHFVEGHPKCGRTHGHNGEITVTFEGYIDDSTGFILDYADLKKLCNDLFVEDMDHAFLVPWTLEEYQTILDKSSEAIEIWNLTKIYCLGLPTTAENISTRILMILEANRPANVFGIEVMFRETPNTSSIVRFFDSSMEM